MIEWLAELDRVGEGLAPVERVAFTGLAVVAVITVSWLASVAKEKLHDAIEPTVADLLASIVVALTVAASATVIVAIWGQVTTVAAAIDQASPGGTWIPQLFLTIAVLMAAYVSTGFVRQIIDDFLISQGHVSDHQREILFRVSQVSIYFVALVVMLGLWEVNLGGLLVGAGFLGIIVGMAARQTLSALIAGFVLMFARPFEIGDWVQVADDEGIVTDITIVNTRIQTFDGEYVMIPNDEVSGGSITNRTRKGRLRIQLEVGVDYEADVDDAMEVAKTAMREVDEVLPAPAPSAVAMGFEDSAVVLGLRFWIDNPSARRRARTTTAVVRNVKRAFEREGIKIPFPQRELSGRTETGGFRIAGGSRPVEPEPATDGGDQ